MFVTSVMYTSISGCISAVYVQPSSVSYVVKEIAFRGMQMDTSFLQFWVALFQFFIGFAFLPVTSLPLLGRGPNKP